MSTPTFGELLAKYMQRAGISDSELARAIGVQRQTIFRWKEGLVARPRAREDVLRCAAKLRLTREERDQLLLAAGFPPEELPAPATTAEPLTAEVASPLPATVAPPVPPAPEHARRTVAPTTPLPSIAIPAARPVVRWPRWATLLVVGLLFGAGGLLWSTRLGLPPFNPVTTPTAASALLLSQPVTLRPTPTTLLTTTLVTNGVEPPTTPVAALAPWPTASPQEMLLVVAQFTGHSTAQFDVASRIEEKLQEQIADLGINQAVVRIWSTPLQNKFEAAQVLTATQATIVIWGAYDDGRVQVNWFVRKAERAEKSDFSLTLPTDLVVTINENVPKEIQSVAFYTFGRLFQSQGNIEKATSAYVRGLELEPNSDRLAALLHFYAGRVISIEQREQASSVQLKNYTAAREHYTAAYQRNPRLYNALYNRGTIWLNQALLLTETTAITASLTAAIDDLTKLLVDRPQSADAYFNRSLAYYHRNQADDQNKALADLNQVTLLEPQRYTGWYQRALVQLRQGDDLAWATDLTRTLALSPTYNIAYDAFCWGYALAQQPEAALPYCVKAQATQDPLDPNRTSDDAFGIIYAQLGRYAEAIAALEKYRTWVERHHPQEYSRRRGPEIESWIAALQQQQNPFDPQTLARLR